MHKHIRAYIVGAGTFQTRCDRDWQTDGQTEKRSVYIYMYISVRACTHTYMHANYTRAEALSNNDDAIVRFGIRRDENVALISVVIVRTPLSVPTPSISTAFTTPSSSTSNASAPANRTFPTSAPSNERSTFGLGGGLGAGAGTYSAAGSGGGVGGGPSSAGTYSAAGYTTNTSGTGGRSASGYESSGSVTSGTAYDSDKSDRYDTDASSQSRYTYRMCVCVCVCVCVCLCIIQCMCVVDAPRIKQN